MGLRVGYWVAVSVGWSVWSRRLCMTGVGLRCCVRVSALLACAGIIFVFVFVFEEIGEGLGMREKGAPMEG